MFCPNPIHPSQPIWLVAGTGTVIFFRLWWFAFSTVKKAVGLRRWVGKAICFCPGQVLCCEAALGGRQWFWAYRQIPLRRPNDPPKDLYRVENRRLSSPPLVLDHYDRIAQIAQLLQYCHQTRRIAGAARTRFV